MNSWLASETTIRLSCFIAVLAAMAGLEALLRLKLALDRALRLVLVTPDMHRVHHSTNPRETDSNYGFNLALWDRLFATYRAQPALGHDGMAIGVADFRDPEGQRIDRMLTQPLRDREGK